MVPGMSREPASRTPRTVVAFAALLSCSHPRGTRVEFPLRASRGSLTGDPCGGASQGTLAGEPHGGPSREAPQWGGGVRLIAIVAGLGGQILRKTGSVRCQFIRVC